MTEIRVKKVDLKNHSFFEKILWQNYVMTTIRFQQKFFSELLFYYLGSELDMSLMQVSQKTQNINKKWQMSKSLEQFYANSVEAKKQ